MLLCHTLRDCGEAYYFTAPCIFLLFLGNRRENCFLPLFRNFSQLPWLFKDNWQWTCKTPVSSLGTYRDNLSAPMNLDISSLFMFFLIWSFSMDSLFPSFPLVSGSWEFLKVSFAGENWGREGIEYLNHFHGLCHQCLAPLCKAHIFCSLFSAIYVLVESFLVNFYIQKSWKSQLQVSLDFPNDIPAKLEKILHLSQVICPSFHPLHASFLCLSTVRNSLVTYRGFLMSLISCFLK